MNATIGIDVGGTFIKGGLIAPDGAIVESIRIPTETERGAAHVVDRIAGLAHSLASKGTISRIGIGMPGLVDRDLSTVRYPPNFPGWEVIDLAQRVAHATGIATVVDNDANCAALGEATYGAGRDISNFILATIGTGVGGGIIVDGELYRGETGAAGEIGHTTVDFRGPQCNCGSFGCVETYIGNYYFCERVRRALGAQGDSTLAAVVSRGTDLTPELIARAAEEGDAFARAQLYDAGYALGVGLANAMGLFDIHTIIVGGGIAQAGELIFAGTRRAIVQFSQQPMGNSFKLLTAQLGNSAGMLGAAALASRLGTIE